MLFASSISFIHVLTSRVLGHRDSGGKKNVLKLANAKAEVMRKLGGLKTIEAVKEKASAIGFEDADTIDKKKIIRVLQKFKKFGCLKNASPETQETAYLLFLAEPWVQRWSDNYLIEVNKKTLDEAAAELGLSAEYIRQRVERSEAEIVFGKIHVEAATAKVPEAQEPVAALLPQLVGGGVDVISKIAVATRSADEREAVLRDPHAVRTLLNTLAAASPAADADAVAAAVEAAKVLRNLCQRKESRQQLVDAGILIPLLRVLNQGGVDLTHSTLQTLRALIRDQEDAVVQAAKVTNTPLVKGLMSLLPLRETTAKPQEDILRVLWGVASTGGKGDDFFNSDDYDTFDGLSREGSGTVRRIASLFITRRDLAAADPDDETRRTTMVPITTLRDDVCSVCLEPLGGKVRRPVRQCSSCGQQFHLACLNDMLKHGATRKSKDPTCPMCRAVIDE